MMSALSTRTGTRARRTFELPGLDPDPVRAAVCLYTNAPDGHFVIGALPGWPNLTLVSACSGHGFKFAPVIGEVVADLVLDGRTDYPIGLFDPARLRA